MRTIVSLFFLVTSSGAFAQTKGAIPARYDQQTSTEHFVLVWNTSQATPEEIEEAKEFSEEVYGKLSEILGVKNMPKQKLIITFGGEGMDRVRKRKRTPHVDNSGRIHLYRFDEGGYLSVLPHEMVHAIRMNAVAQWNGFFEEGFASAIAYFLYPERKGFPRFGFQLDLIAGYWLISGRGIPLEKMRTDHSRLNLKCQLQTYVTREDFFNYLITRFGLEKMINYAYSKEVGNVELYQTIWGKSFVELTEEWKTDLSRRYDHLEKTKERIERYFERTSARYIPVCEAGSDY